MREEVLARHFGDALGRLAFDEEVAGWMTLALREIHGDEKRLHNQAIVRLQSDYPPASGREP